MTEISIIAIIVAAISCMAIGMYWYSPLGFGKPWMKEMKFSKKQLAKGKQGMGKTMIAAFVAAVVTASVLEVLTIMIGSNSLIQGALLGMLVWAGFVATVLLNTVLWEGKSTTLYLINAGHSIVQLTVVGAIVALL